jgi:hypothetical protein
MYADDRLITFQLFQIVFNLHNYSIRLILPVTPNRSYSSTFFSIAPFMNLRLLDCDTKQTATKLEIE